MPQTQASPFERVSKILLPLRWLFIGLFLLTGCATTQPTTSMGKPAPHANGANADVAKPTLWIIGDSTVRLNNDTGKGWGEVIDAHFDLDKITIANRAIGGRSSRTFRTDGRWRDILTEAQPGDFVLMQFGHNDPIAPDDPQRPRGTLRGAGNEYVDIIHPQTKLPERVYTYGWYMRQYIREAQQQGMIPIVCSYIPRAPRPGETADPTLSSYGLYAKIVADEENAAFIDLYGMLARAFVALEVQQPHVVKERFYVPGDRDYTHTNADGAKLNAAMVVRGIRALASDQPAGRLKQFLKPGDPDL